MITKSLAGSTATEHGDRGALLLAAFECLGAAVSILDADFKIVFQNSSHKRLAGNRVGERCFEALHHRNAPCDGCGMGASLVDGKVHVSRQCGQTPDGISCYETTSPIIDGGGKILGGVKLVVDITERSRAEESLKQATGRLRTLVDAIPDTIFFKDKDGRYILVNHAFTRILGLTEADVLGKSDDDLLARELADVCRERDREVLEARKPVRSEQVVTSADGDRMFVDTLKVPLYATVENRSASSASLTTSPLRSGWRRCSRRKRTAGRDFWRCLATSCAIRWPRFAMLPTC